MLNDAARTAIEAGRLGHLTTLNADGSPQTTVIWAGLDGEQVVIGSMDDRAKLRNIRRDPRVSLSIESDGTTHGLRDYLVIEGDAEVVEGGAFEWLRHLAPRYLGDGAVFPPEELRGPGFRILITPVKVRGNGPWKD